MESLGRLGIDVWSLLVYAVNLGLIVFILAKFFTKPLLDAIDKRRNQISDNINEAERFKNELVKQKDLMEKEKEALRAKVEEEMRTFNLSIDKRKKDAEAEIEASKAKMLADIKRVMDEEKANLQANVKKEVAALVEKMVLYIVNNKIPREVVEDSTKDAWNLYKR